MRRNTPADVRRRLISTPLPGYRPHMIWNGSLDTSGYGQVRFEGRMYMVKNLIWLWENGPVPPGLLVLHKVECHNRQCAEITHLYLGTIKQNLDDRKINGTTLDGERNGRAVTTWNVVRRIRAAHRVFPDLKIRDLSEVFGLTEGVVANIVNEHSWREGD